MGPIVKVLTLVSKPVCHRRSLCYRVRVMKSPRNSPSDSDDTAPGSRPPRRPLAVVTMGSGALLSAADPGSSRDVIRASRKLARPVMTLLQEGYRVLVVLGAGPEIERELMRNEESATKAPARPLDLCIASSQGTLGELVSREVRNLLRRDRMVREVVTLHTQVLVSLSDPGTDTTQMVGPSLTEWRARELMKTTKWHFVEDTDKRWRRVVATPLPVDVLGTESIATLVGSGAVVFAAGGGGVPLAVDAKGEFVGVEAWVSKDLTAALLAEQLAAEVLVMLTSVDTLYTHYGLPNQEALACLTASRLRDLAAEGHFPAGGLGVKVEAALQFLDSGGETVVFTSPEKLAQALADRGGTRVSRRTRNTGVRHQLQLSGLERGDSEESLEAT